MRLAARFGVSAGIAGALLISATHASAGKADGFSLEKRCGEGIGTRQVVGTVIGGVLGGLLGNAVGGRGNKTATTVAGVGLGGVVGNRLGHAWDTSECEKARKAMALAMSTGTSQTWRSDDGQRSFSYMIDRKYDRTQQSNISVLEGRQIETGGYAQADGVYLVSKPVNIRDRPSTSGSKIFENIKPGRKLAALGKSAGGDWLLVSSTGSAAEGWVSTSYLTKTQDDQAAFARANSDNRPVTVTTVAYSQPCMDTHQQMTDANAKPKQRTQTSGTSVLCQASDGKWTPQQA